MLNDTQLMNALQNSPAPRVTKEHIEGQIKSTQWDRLGETVTVCTITLWNGYSVRGEAACVNPANYNAEIGQRVSYDDAFRKLWPLYGFLLAEYNYLNRDQAQESAGASPSGVGEAA